MPQSISIVNSESLSWISKQTSAHKITTSSSIVEFLWHTGKVEGRVLPTPYLHRQTFIHKAYAVFVPIRVCKPSAENLMAIAHNIVFTKICSSFVKPNKPSDGHLRCGQVSNYKIWGYRNACGWAQFSTITITLVIRMQLQTMKHHQISIARTIAQADIGWRVG